MRRTPQKRIVLIGFTVVTACLGAAVGYRYARERRRSWKQLQRQGEAAEQAWSRAPLPGDILLFHHARADDLAITLFTHSPFYHAAIYAGNGRVVEARPKGVVESGLRGRENDYIVIPAPEGKGKEALAWARSQIGAPYDNEGVLVIILEHLFTRLHLNYTPKGRYTCGEFVAMAFARAGVRLFPDRDLNDVVPGDFARLLPPAAQPQT